jgi:hypothetical protein
MNLFAERLEQLKNQKVKLAANFWQEQAAQAVKDLNIELKYKSQIFRAYKRDNVKAEAIKRNMEGKKLKDPGIYFLALMRKKV